MIDYLSSIILKYFIRSSVIENTVENKEIYKYGAEITISSFLNIILVLLLGFITSEIVGGIVFLFVLISMRSLTGGYHADTYFRCNLILCLNFISLVIIYKITPLNLSIIDVIIGVLASLIPIIIFAPVDNANKRTTMERKGRLKILAVILGTIYGSAAVVLYVFNYKIGIMVLYTLLSVSVALITAKFKERKWLL